MNQRFFILFIITIYCKQNTKEHVRMPRCYAFLTTSHPSPIQQYLLFLFFHYSSCAAVVRHCTHTQHDSPSLHAEGDAAVPLLADVILPQPHFLLTQVCFFLSFFSAFLRLVCFVFYLQQMVIINKIKNLWFIAAAWIVHTCC